MHFLIFLCAVFLLLQQTVSWLKKQQWCERLPLCTAAHKISSHSDITGCWLHWKEIYWRSTESSHEYSCLVLNKTVSLNMTDRINIVSLACCSCSIFILFHCFILSQLPASFSKIKSNMRVCFRAIWDSFWSRSLLHFCSFYLSLDELKLDSPAINNVLWVCSWCALLSHNAMLKIKWKKFL